MESVMRRFSSLLPKSNFKTLAKEYHTDDDDKESLAYRYFLFFGKRALVVFVCFHLIFYRIVVCCVGHLFGKWLLKWQIVPYHIYEPTDIKEDPGVIEMRALLRGEDCYDYNLDQSQRRPSTPADFNPYEEIYLLSFHTRMIEAIRRLLISLKEHDEPFAQSFNRLFTWFDKQVYDGYLKSQVIVNKRD